MPGSSVVHDLTEATEFATGSEVACHLSQSSFVFRDGKPVAVIDWDETSPGIKVRNFGEFLWAFVHPAMYGDGEPAARMLRTAADAYGWRGGSLVDSMLGTVRRFQHIVAGDRKAEEWGAAFNPAELLRPRECIDHSASPRWFCGVSLGTRGTHTPSLKCRRGRSVFR